MPLQRPRGHSVQNGASLTHLYVSGLWESVVRLYWPNDHKATNQCARMKAKP